MYLHNNLATPENRARTGQMNCRCHGSPEVVMDSVFLTTNALCHVAISPILCVNDSCNIKTRSIYYLCGAHKLSLTLFFLMSHY